MSGVRSNTMSGQAGQAEQHVQSTIPLVFIRENSFFGDRKPSKPEWISHVELYNAISTRIDASHITGLQRVKGLWRIYLDNLNDKVKLMAEGVPLRGKTIPVLNTNPQRPDGENTIRIRVKNIPLSADDGIISRTITLRGAEVISITREKLRVDGRLTNCETGDRFVVVKASSLKEPLPTLMTFGMFTARVFHSGQTTDSRPEPKCTKCLQSGHRFSDCGNEWVCKQCNLPGHKQSDCKSKLPADDNQSDVSDAETERDEHRLPVRSPRKQRKRRSTSLNNRANQPNRSVSRDTLQQTMKNFVAIKTNTDTPVRNSRGNLPERSPPTPIEILQEKSQKKSKNPKK